MTLFCEERTRMSLCTCSTRFTGYKKAMLESGYSVFGDNDPDGRRKRYNVNLSDEAAVNRMILDMLEYGFSDTPDTQRC